MRSYPWYEPVEGDRVAQGDLLLRLPVILPVPDLAVPLGDDVAVEIQEYDCVVMTQTCDLEQEKVKEVILCPHWSPEEAASMDPSLAGKNAPEEIRKGRRPRYLLLNSSDVDGLPLECRIVDFGRIFSLPKHYVRAFAAERGRRLRLCPPYREHLAQGFARFFMRVGLPQDIKL